MLVLAVYDHLRNLERSHQQVLGLNEILVYIFSLLEPQRLRSHSVGIRRLVNGLLFFVIIEKLFHTERLLL